MLFVRNCQASHATLTELVLITYSEPHPSDDR